jgi:hypothetical protein
LKLFLRKDYDSLITCELICAGPTSAKVHKEYTDFLNKQYNSKITGFSVRHKKTGWTPPYLRAEFANGQVFEKPFYETEYGYAFAVFSRSACYNCKFRGNNRKGDIMIGDYWGASDSDKFWNKNGVSIIFAHTEKGKSLIESVPNLELFISDFEKAVKNNRNVIEKKFESPMREKFSELFAKKGLFYAAKHARPLKSKLRNNAVHIIPRPWVPFAKRVYRFIK